jgi:2-polyprenyl-3-methyl-5-hydroxy-6-metoxy-1,4-benzoquinol methylase
MMTTSINAISSTIAEDSVPASRDFPAQTKENSVPASQLRTKRIGVLIVAYNAVTTLTRVLQRIPENVWANVEEVVVFDDASKDATYELAVGYKAISGIDKLNIIKNNKNLGYGGNQKLGYTYFMDKGFDAVVLLHGDGQYAPEILSHLYEPLISGEADAVFGSRMMPEYGGALKGGMPLYKYIGNRILTFFENFALNMHLTEFHSGYRAYNLDILRQIDFTNMTDDFHFDTEIIIKLHQQGFRIKEVPIPTYYGDEICYVNGLKYAKDVAKSVIRYKRTIRSVACHPEFAEYFIHYPLKTSKYSSHYYFTLLAGRNNQILDIGCGEGFFAAKIAAAGNQVVGIDLLPEAKLVSTFEQYISADLDKGLSDAKVALANHHFDRILLQDVLEHLRHPEQLLQDCHDLLKPSGQLLVSVPNIANITVRIALLLGRFEYAQRGILDKTHMRFFTRRSARRLLEENGYKIIDEKTTVMPLELALGVSPDNTFMRKLNGILATITNLMPGIFGYQILFVARSRARSQGQ